LPLLVASLVDDESRIAAISGSALLFLALLGGLAAQTGGARVTIGVLRVTFWGAVAMGATASIGALMGVAVG
jgi:VIT1/CCC1 family predicted Fe2+/Mn2+ transporter